MNYYIVETWGQDSRYADSVCILAGPFAKKAEAARVWREAVRPLREAADVDFDDDGHVCAVDDGDYQRTILIATYNPPAAKTEANSKGD